MQRHNQAYLYIEKNYISILYIVDIFLKIFLQQHDNKMVALDGRLNIGLGRGK